MPQPINFLLKVKSTIDKMGVDIANKLDMAEFLDVDDRERYTESIMESKKDAVIWRVISYDPRNHDKLYSLLFVVGVSLHSDTNNSKALQSAGVIADTFKKGCTIPVRDYTVKPPTEPPTVGTISVTFNGVDESINTGLRGFKWVTIRAVLVNSE